MKTIIDNASGATGIFGIFVGLVPDTPSEGLIFCSTLLIICQLVHWVWRFIKWFKGENK